MIGILGLNLLDFKNMDKYSLYERYQSGNIIIDWCIGKLLKLNGKKLILQTFTEYFSTIENTAAYILILAWQKYII